MDYKDKLPGELPLGSYERDPVDPDQKELSIWGRALDGVEIDNKQLLEGLASPAYAADWMIERYEKQYGIEPPVGATLADRRLAVIAKQGLRRNLSIPTMQAIAKEFLGYAPIVRPPPRPFYLGWSHFRDGSVLIEKVVKFTWWVEINAALTTRSFIFYNGDKIVAALRAAGPADVNLVYLYWSDEPFNLTDYF